MFVCFENLGFFLLLIVEIKKSNASPKDVGELKNSPKSGELRDDERIFLLFSAWTAALDRSKDVKGQFFQGEWKGITVPKAPHLEDCKASVEINNHLNKHDENGSSLPWTLWRGLLGTKLLHRTLEAGQMHSGYNTKFEGAYPPWVCIFVVNE